MADFNEFPLYHLRVRLKLVYLKALVLAHCYFPSAITDVDVNLYVDDIKLYYFHSDFSELCCIIQSAVAQIFTWLFTNKLKLKSSLC